MDYVEKSNRTLKGPLRIRPLYLRSDQRIESLILIILLALLVRVLLQVCCQRAGLLLSTEQLLAGFEPLATTELTFVDGSHLCKLGTLSAFQRQVLAALQLSAPSRYLTELSKTAQLDICIGFRLAHITAINASYCQIINWTQRKIRSLRRRSSTCQGLPRKVCGTLESSLASTNCRFKLAMVLRSSLTTMASAIFTTCCVWDGRIPDPGRIQI